MNNILKGIETIIFCDETKFNINNNRDVEDATTSMAARIEGFASKVGEILSKQSLCLFSKRLLFR
jgi:hypothetical protein